jgi:uncharacterized protein (TIGR00369 family)
MSDEPTVLDPTMRGSIERFFAEEIPFNRYLGLRLVSLERGVARLHLPFKPELVGDPFRPALHGGVISAALDTAGGAAVFSMLALGDRVSTVDIRVDYLRPGRLEDLFAEATIKRVGNRMGVTAIRAYHASAPDESVAEAMGVYNIRREQDR